MMAKPKPIGTVFLSTNTVNGMFYIGAIGRPRADISPSEFGMGSRLKAAVKEFGVDAFIRETLYEGPDYVAERRKHLETMNAGDNPECYNVMRTANPGAVGHTPTKKQRQRVSATFKGTKQPTDQVERTKRSKDPAFREDFDKEEFEE